MCKKEQVRLGKKTVVVEKRSSTLIVIEYSREGDVGLSKILGRDESCGD